MGKWDSSDEDDAREAGPAAHKKARREDSAPPAAAAAAPAPAPAPAPALTLAPAPPAPFPAPPVTPAEHDSLVNGCRSVELYEHISFIDQGTYGLVFKARCRESGAMYALKQVKLVGAEANKVGFPITALREINILLSLRHPNIVRVREMVVGSTADKVFMVMEFCEKDLKACMQQAKQPFSTGEVKQLLQQLLSAVAYMHSRWLVHRDLKTSNLLYSHPGRLTVCDFGLARTFGSPLAPLTAEVVTLWYRCPELLLGSALYSTALDVWSVGCILGEMLQGKPLLPGEGEADQLAKIFSLLGPPSADRWPEAAALPNFPAVASAAARAPSRGRLRETFLSGHPSALGAAGTGSAVRLSEAGLGLLGRLLELSPARRVSAAAALEDVWLAQELPAPTALDRMPRFGAPPEAGLERARG